MDAGALFWGLFLLLVLAAAMLTGLWSYRAFTTGDTSFSLSWLFPPRPEPRLGVVEQASVDKRRKLVLIRRDDVEHLIMIGGPVDVLIEDKIPAPSLDMADVHEDRQEPTAPIFARGAHGFGQAVNE